MIPATIHYCWFGRGKMPHKAVNCINSWKKILPDYKLQLWNEDTFDVNGIPYVKEAYEARKFAFVTDYVRLHALYHFGGIYMDTDIEMLKNIDELLNLPAFLGFESETEIQTGIMASEPHGEWVQQQLNYYVGKHFLRASNRYDLTTNVETISAIMATHGFAPTNSYQVYNNCLHIFPKDYFCPKSRSGIITCTQNTYCIHHFEGSWLPYGSKMKKYIFRHILGPNLTDKLVNFKRNLIKNKFIPS